MIRKTEYADLGDVMDVFSQAIQKMRRDGNMHQWTGGYPSTSAIENDIASGTSYVGVDGEGRIYGTFAAVPGPDPTYAELYPDPESGQCRWLDDCLPYVVIHRIASAEQAHGFADSCFGFVSAVFAGSGFGSIRIDTHRDNGIMRNLLASRGFTYCGIIHLENGDERLAYQKMFPYQ